MLIPDKFTDLEIRESKAVVDVLDGASVLSLTAAKIETAVRASNTALVVLKKSEMQAVAKSLRLAAQMIDLLTLSIERHDPVSRVFHRR